MKVIWSVNEKPQMLKVRLGEAHRRKEDGSKLRLCRKE